MMYKGIATDQDFEFYCDFKPTLFFVNLKKNYIFSGTTWNLLKKYNIFLGTTVRSFEDI